MPYYLKKTSDVEHYDDHLSVSHLLSLSRSPSSVFLGGDGAEQY